MPGFFFSGQFFRAVFCSAQRARDHARAKAQAIMQHRGGRGRSVFVYFFRMHSVILRGDKFIPPATHARLSAFLLAQYCQ
jgi:hypothetical protein